MTFLFHNIPWKILSLLVAFGIWFVVMSSNSIEITKEVNLDLEVPSGLTIANEVLIPVEAHVMALHGLVQLLKTVNLVKQRLNPQLEITGILPCRVDYRTKHSQEVLTQLRTRFEGKVCKSVIRENIRLAEAPLHLKPIIHYDPSCHGSHDYRQLAQEIMGNL